MAKPDYPVELKVTLSTGVDAAVAVLDLRHGRPRQVWFLEDDTPGLAAAIPLLNAGLILRLRSDPKRDQSTVKLRPARRSQLVGRWQQPFENGDEEYRIESDWAGSRNVLAASCVVQFPAGTFAPLLKSGDDLSQAFTERQLDFVVRCAGMPLNISGLSAFGPIGATQWKDQKLDGLRIDAERWTVGVLDFLELSARADERTAAEHHDALAAAATTRGLGPDAEQAPKTTTMLRYLMRRNP